MKKNIRLKALALAVLIAGTSAGMSGCSNDDNSDDLNQAIVSEISTMQFNAGEHIISVPIEGDIRNGCFQHQFRKGYRPIGISLSAYGKLSNNYYGGAIIYSNTETVECVSTFIDESGNYVYADFGIPFFDDFSDVNDSNEPVKEFGIGEHIISVPMNDNRSENLQIEYREGYEIVGMASTAYGQHSDNYGGGVLLYVNTVPVKCTLDENGYTSFGIPLEISKTKSLG